MRVCCLRTAEQLGDGRIDSMVREILKSAPVVVPPCQLKSRLHVDFNERAEQYFDLTILIKRKQSVFFFYMTSSTCFILKSSQLAI